MAIRRLTKDGMVPVQVRFTPEDFDLVKRYAFEADVTANKAIVQLVLDAVWGLYAPEKLLQREQE